MAVSLVTGHAGSEHITSSDVGRLLLGTVGPDTYVLGDLPTVTMRDANTLVMSKCDLMVRGRHVAVSGDTTVAVESGAPGTWRHDLVCVRYSVESSVESATLALVTGTPATSASAAADPSVAGGAIGDGTAVDVPVARVTLDGLRPSAALTVGRLDPLASVATAARAVSRVSGMWTGTTNGITDGNGELLALSRGDVVRVTGSGFDWQRDWFGVMSGHRDNGVTVNMSAEYNSALGNLYVACVNPGANGAVLRSQWVLINWLLVKGA